MSNTSVLNEQHVDYELIPHRRTHSVAAEARAIGVDPGGVAKTIVLATEAGFVRAVLSASDRILSDDSIHSGQVASPPQPPAGQREGYRPVGTRQLQPIQSVPVVLVGDYLNPRRLKARIGLIWAAHSRSVLQPPCGFIRADTDGRP